MANSTLLNLLVVADESAERTLFRHQLVGLTAVIEERTTGEAVAAFSRCAFDGVVLGWSQYNGASFDVITRLRKAGDRTPILCVADQDEDVAAALMAAGATDFMTKAELTPKRLVRRLRHAITCCKTERELERARVGQAAQRALLRAVLRHVPVGVALVDATDGRWLHINRLAARVLSGEETSLVDAERDQVAVAARQAIDDALRTGKIVTGAQLITPRGQPVRLTAARISDEVGRVVAGVLVIDDVDDGTPPAPDPTLPPSADQLATWAQSRRARQR